MFFIEYILENAEVLPETLKSPLLEVRCETCERALVLEDVPEAKSFSLACDSIMTLLPCDI